MGVSLSSWFAGAAFDMLEFPAAVVASLVQEVRITSQLMEQVSETGCAPLTVWLQTSKLLCMCMHTHACV